MIPGVVLIAGLAVAAGPSGPSPAAAPAPFTDVTAEAGISWVHEEGATGEKLLPETMGGGVAFLDYDRDGDPDLLLVDSGRWPAGGADGEKSPEPAARPLAALYANETTAETGIRFRDVTAETGLAEILASPASPASPGSPQNGPPSYGQGVAVGDYDGDGWPDLYLTAAGPNRLLRNRGAGPGGARFEDVTEASGTVGGETWSTGAAFFDADGDGHLDLFVANYLEWSPKLDRSEAKIAERTVAFRDDTRGVTYGRPQSYRGAQPFLFTNRGDGTFTEVAEAAGLHVTGPEGPVAKALAVAPADVDRDGRTDLLVANDTTRNLFFHNRTEPDGAPRFEEAGELFGLAYDADGRATGAMGVDWGELEGGALAFLVGNFAAEASSLYRAQGDPTFYADQSMAAGLAGPTRGALTFAVLLFDPDLDGRLDLLQANGHVEPDIERVDAGQRYLQPAQLFRSAAGEGSAPARWTEIPAEATGALATPIAGRGAAYADVDGDGDLDLALTRIGGPPVLLRNDQATGHHWLRLRLVNEAPNRDAIGARVTVATGEGETRRAQTRDVQPTRGYLSAVELPLTFGLGGADEVDRVEVTWPDGAVEVFEVEGVDRVVEIVRGRGRAATPEPSAPAASG